VASGDDKARRGEAKSSTRGRGDDGGKASFFVGSRAALGAARIIRLRCSALSSALGAQLDELAAERSLLFH
jgi:hypothetical protein